MKTLARIKDYEQITQRLGREPNDLEACLFSAMWSEHCGYGHSKKYLARFPRGGSLYSDENAGAVQVGGKAVFFKAESHNHPSAVEPFQGAATGVGGIIRDVLALGARPIALLNSLKFGQIEGGSRAKWLFDGVVRGIGAYANSIGVPTVGGEVSFDACYEASPLVNVMAVGIADKADIKTSAAPAGQYVVLVGSHTGRDGVHGAAFASKELSKNSKDDRPSVQTGDPFMGKKLIEATLEILKLDEVSACQDCGAAGILSSTSEMAYKGGCGMELHLDRVHLREDDIEPWEIMLSESQERMVFTASEVERIFEIAAKYEIPAREIGKTIPEQEYRLVMSGETVANVPPAALNNAVLYDLDETEPAYICEFRDKKLSQTMSVEAAVEKVVSDPNFASKEWVYTQFDHTVGSATMPRKAGAAGVWLGNDGVLGLTMDSNGRQVFLDPYNGSKNVVYTSFRKLAAAGCKPLGVTNCLNFGNPEKGEVGYQFVKSVDGIADGCRELAVPVVSGNVSLYNECEGAKVYPTPVIGMVGLAQDLIAPAFSAGEKLYLLGREINDNSPVGGSLYQMACFGFLGGEIDRVDAELEHSLAETIHKLRDKKLINGAVDVAQGGLLGAILKGIFNGSTGFNGSLIGTAEPLKALFGEITGRYVASTDNPSEFEKHCGVPYKYLGECTGNAVAFDGYSFANLKTLYTSAIAKEMTNV